MGWFDGGCTDGGISCGRGLPPGIGDMLRSLSATAPRLPWAVFRCPPLLLLFRGPRLALPCVGVSAVVDAMFGLLGKGKDKADSRFGVNEVIFGKGS